MMLRLEIPGKRLRGRPKRRLIDENTEGMRVIGVSKEYTEDWVR